MLLSSTSWSQEACRALFQRDDTVVEVISSIESEIKNHRVNMKILDGPKEALSAKLLAIRQAKKTIDITVFQLFRDETGYLFLSEIKRAAERGVRVRLLVDAIGSKDISHHELEYLLKNFSSSNRPEVKLANLAFHPRTSFARFMSLLKGETSFVNWLFAVNSRVHEKLLLVDSGTGDSLVIFGSANMTNKSTGLGHSELDYNREVEVVIRPVAGTDSVPVDLELTKYFESLYEYIGNHQLWDRSPELFDLSGKKMKQNYANAAQHANEAMNLEANLEKMSQENFLTSDLTPSDFELVHDLPNLIRKKNIFNMNWFRWGKSINERSVIRSLSKRMLSAKKRIEIISPYLLIGSKDIRKIEKLLLKKPNLELHIYINSFTVIDHRSTSAYFEEFVGPKLAELKRNSKIGERLKIKTYIGHSSTKLRPSFFHTKAVRIDDEFLIGSHNFDFRSILSNSEMGAWMNSSKGHANLQALIADIDQHSIEWGSPAWQALIQKDPAFTRFKLFFKSLCQAFSCHILL